MSCIEDILSRALLDRTRTTPPDVVPHHTSSTSAGDANLPMSSCPDSATEDLRALCETVIAHTPACVVSDFITDQLPGPDGSLVLACVLQLTDTADGARFWWQYAAGAGKVAAAYCLYLHHLSLGEHDTAIWWHRQTDNAEDSPDSDPAPQAPPEEPRTWNPDGHRICNSKTSTMLRVLRRLAKGTERPRTTAVAALMRYMPTAVATGYLRQPEMELPMPGEDFSARITELLDFPQPRWPNASPLPPRPTGEVLAT